MWIFGPDELTPDEWSIACDELKIIDLWEFEEQAKLPGFKQMSETCASLVRQCNDKGPGSEDVAFPIICALLFGDGTGSKYQEVNTTSGTVGVIAIDTRSVYEAIGISFTSPLSSANCDARITESSTLLAIASRLSLARPRQLRRLALGYAAAGQSYAFDENGASELPLNFVDLGEKSRIANNDIGLFFVAGVAHIYFHELGHHLFCHSVEMRERSRKTLMNMSSLIDSEKDSIQSTEDEAATRLKELGISGSPVTFSSVKKEIEHALASGIVSSFDFEELACDIFAARNLAFLVSAYLKPDYSRWFVLWYFLQKLHHKSWQFSVFCDRLARFSDDMFKFSDWGEWIEPPGGQEQLTYFFDETSAILSRAQTRQFCYLRTLGSSVNQILGSVSPDTLNGPSVFDKVRNDGSSVWAEIASFDDAVEARLYGMALSRPGINAMSSRGRGLENFLKPSGVQTADKKAFDVFAFYSFGQSRTP